MPLPAAAGHLAAVLAPLAALMALVAGETLWFTVTTVSDAVASVWSHHLPLKG